MAYKDQEDVTVPLIFNYLSPEEQRTVVEVVGSNNLIIVAFNPNGEMDARLINIQTNDEYREFVLGVCKRMALKKAPKGQVLCHKGEVGEDMYIILHGKVGVFLEKTPPEVQKQKAEVQALCAQLKEKLKGATRKDTILKNTEFPYKDKIADNLDMFPLEDQETLIFLLTYFETVSSWPKEMLYLLASNRPLQYMASACFTYWMAAVKRAGDIIGEQALLNRTQRNASLLALSKVELLTLDKAAFDDYLGAAAAKQEERVKFFLYCFSTISRRSINNFQCMFHRSTKMRGEVIATKGEEATHFFVVEEGEVAFVDGDNLIQGKKIDIGKLSIVGSPYKIVTVGKYGFVGDEVLFDDRYKFTLVAMRQPTFLYSIEKEKLVTAGTILGKEVMKELVSQSMDRMAFRSCKMQEMNSKTGKTKPDSQPKGFRLRQKIIKTSCSEMGEKLDRQFQDVCYVSEMIRGLLHPADPKKKYTMVRNKYKDHSTHKSPSPPKEKPIMISQLQFKKVQSSQDSPNQSQLGLKHNMSRTGSMKMTRKSSNHSGLGSRLEKGSTPGESHREPDNTITINNVASSVAYFKPSVGPGQPWNYSDYKKKFLHLQEKDNTAEKKNVTKKLPAFVSICSLKKKRKESMASTMEGYRERNNSVDLSEALRLEEGNPDERFYLKKHISNPIIGRPRFNSLNQNSNSHSFLRQTAPTMNVHPKELAGRTSSAKMIRYQSRSLSSADILKISNIQIEQ